MKGFELGEEPIALAILATGSAFFGSLVVFVDIFEFLLAFLCTPFVS